MRAGLRATLETALESKIVAIRPLRGGDVNEAWLLALSDGRRVFAKSHAKAPPDLFAREAEGLAWLAGAGALRVPAAIAWGRGADAFLVLEYLATADRRADFDEVLGRGLAALHLAGARYFGGPRDNYVGVLPQINAETESWAGFYREQRLAPLFRQARDTGLLDASIVQRADGLVEHLEVLVGPTEPPARLHGDLWSGNLHVDDEGSPALIDPAAYGGHREVDLAMMRLFGGFDSRTFAAYAEIHPLASGAEERVPLYQLYPLLVHLNLFGVSYAEGVARCVATYT